MPCYFVSDTHIGESSPETEGRLVAWLERVRADADAIFLAGDIFDFWFEYKRVVPKGFARLFAKIREITAAGTPVHFFAGNHDMWVYDYFEKECGMTVHPGGKLFDLYGKKVYVEHGDAISADDFKVKTIQKIFRSRTARCIFSALVHPDLALRFGNWWSRSSRMKRTYKHTFRGEDEPVVRFARQYLAGEHVDYFVFGHLHCPTEYTLTGNSTLYVLGGWINDDISTYGVLRSDGAFSTYTLE